MPFEGHGFQDVGFGPFPLQISVVVDLGVGLVCLVAAWGGRRMARSLHRVGRLSR